MGLPWSNEMVDDRCVESVSSVKDKDKDISGIQADVRPVLELSNTRHTGLHVDL